MAPAEKERPQLFTVESSPHVSGSLTTPRVMIDVLIALLPATLAALWLFRGHAVVLLVSCTAGAMAAELLGNRLMGRANSLKDISAIVTGVILAFCLPPNFPFYFAFLGGAVSTGIGKMVFGGLGANIFNPAMVGRAFLTACFGTMMTSWTVPVGLQTIGSPEALSFGAQHGLEAITQATPMGLAKQILKSGGDDPEKLRMIVGLLPKMIVGNVGGSLGETSGLAILIGGIWMLLRGTITWHIPSGVILGALIFALPAWLISPAAVTHPGIHIFGGAMLFGAFIIATDPVTCPLSAKGRFIFGIGVGLLTMLIRVVGGYPEGLMYAVLLMNAFTPFLDRWTEPQPLGLEEAPVRSFLRLSWLVLVCAFAFGLLLAGIYSSWQPRIEENARRKLEAGIRSILAGADSIQTDTLAVASGRMTETAIVYKGLSAAGEAVGYVFTAEGTGFQDRIRLLVGVGPQLRAYRGIAVLFAAETPGFGDAIRDSAIFKCQFVGAPVDPPLCVVKTGNRNKTDDPEIVSITGATITSEAVTTIINRRWGILRERIARRAGGDRGNS